MRATCSNCARDVMHSCCAVQPVLAAQLDTSPKQLSALRFAAKDGVVLSLPGSGREPGNESQVTNGGCVGKGQRGGGKAVWARGAEGWYGLARLECLLGSFAKAGWALPLIVQVAL